MYSAVLLFCVEIAVQVVVPAMGLEGQKEEQIDVAVVYRDRSCTSHETRKKAERGTDRYASTVYSSVEIAVVVAPAMSLEGQKEEQMCQSSVEMAFNRNGRSRMYNASRL